MEKTLTLEEFYIHKFNWLPENLQQDIGHFNVFRTEECSGPGKVPVRYSRKDFYKISMVRGKNRYHYADRSIEVEGTTLIFFNPQVPYIFENLSEGQTGFFCIFKEPFLNGGISGNMNELPMFSPAGKPTYRLDPDQDRFLSEIYEKMLREIASDYRYKFDLIRGYVTELIHFALKLEPAEQLYHHPDAASRITSVFTELLERQFPIESQAQRFTMRSASDFAGHLSVHVNHLNRAIKETTGKTTTEHISDRMTSEAIALLRHTNWNVAEIGYCLGFEEPSHFNNFFKKHTSKTPTAYRGV